MNAGPPGLLHRKSKRVDGSATAGSADRRNRATTVSPRRFVKFTKKRRLVAASGGNASPRSPCSPPDTIDAETSRKSCGSTVPLRTTRMRPPCWTTNAVPRSIGSCTYASGSVNPLASVRTRSCARRSAARTTSNAAVAKRRIASILSHVRRSCIVFVASLTTVCGGSSPQPPVVNPPTTTETITGTERIGWDQPAANAAELATIRYAIYVDDMRSELAGVTCAAGATATRFACSGRLPSLSGGAHALQIASFVVEGTVLESTRSAPLRVNVVAAGASSPGATTVRPGPFVNADGVRMRVELVAEGFNAPADLAFIPD